MNDTAGAFAPIDLELPFAWGGPLGRGRLRVQPEDFQVIELPLVSPDGEGEHSWLYVRKRGSNTEWVARQLAQFAGVSAGAVSWAGLKDRHAVTEQWFSVHLPGRDDPDWPALRSDAFEVLEARRHSRKLRTGALRGNRFSLRVRDVDADADALQQRLGLLAASGFPNAFGPQRFGHGGGNLQQAARWFASPRSRLPRHKRSLYLSAVRAALFNRVLAARIDDGSWNRARPGEVLQLQGKSACFVAPLVDDDIQRRLQANEVHPTGPLCGDGDSLAQDEAAQYEAALLQPWDDWIEGLRRQRLAAARRALRVVPGELRGERDTDGHWMISFTLPAGAYATSLLRELLHCEDAP